MLSRPRPGPPAAGLRVRVVSPVCSPLPVWPVTHRRRDCTCPPVLSRPRRPYARHCQCGLSPSVPLLLIVARTGQVLGLNGPLSCGPRFAPGGEGGNHHLHLHRRPLARAPARRATKELVVACRGTGLYTIGKLASMSTNCAQTWCGQTQPRVRRSHPIAERPLLRRSDRLRQQ